MRNVPARGLPEGNSLLRRCSRGRAEVEAAAGEFIGDGLVDLARNRIEEEADRGGEEEQRLSTRPAVSRMPLRARSVCAAFDT